MAIDVTHNRFTFGDLPLNNTSVIGETGNGAGLFIFNTHAVQTSTNEASLASTSISNPGTTVSHFRYDADGDGNLENVVLNNVHSSFPDSFI